VNFIFGLITVIAGLTATLAGGVLGDWLRPRIRGAYFVVSGVAMFIGFFLFLLVLWVPFPGEGEAGVLTPFGGAWIFVALAIFCLFFNTGPTNTILCNVVHPSMRSTGFALNILIIHGLGDAFSPAIIGYVADHSNLNVGFLLVSGIILVSAVFWLLGARHLERDTERAASLGPRTNDRHAGHCPWPDDC
jgi:dipeptide/tripeptide permease